MKLKFKEFLNERFEEGDCHDDKKNPFKYFDSYLEGDLHQSILDLGYCWWQNKNVDSYYSMVDRMSKKFGDEFGLLILLGKYNQQVENGGHVQYFDNGYASVNSSGYGSHTDIELHEEMIELLENSELSNNNLGRKVLDIMKIFSENLQYIDNLRCEECNASGEIEGDCYNCNGNGQIYDDCPECGGSGEIGDDECSECGGSGEIEVVCDECGGDGTVYEQCPECDGTGEINIEDMIDSSLDNKYYKYSTEWMEYLNKYSEKKMFDKFPEDEEDYQTMLASKKFKL